MERRPLPQEIRRCAIPRRFPDGEPYTGITGVEVAALSEAFGTGRREVEIAALEAGVIPTRYSRNMRAYTVADQLRLLRSRVCVVGLGGLGGGVCEILARMGVGALTLLDGDRFEETNLNRQLLAREDLLGSPKAEAARDRVARINGSVRVRTESVFVDETNARQVLAGHDVLVDGLDNLRTRFILEAAGRDLGIPLVSAAVAGACGQLTVIFPGDPGLGRIYGEAGDNPSSPAEKVLGTLPHAVTFLSTLECAEVAKILLDRGKPLRNRLLVADLNDTTIEILDLT